MEKKNERMKTENFHGEMIAFEKESPEMAKAVKVIEKKFMRFKDLRKEYLEIQKKESWLTASERKYVVMVYERHLKGGK